MERYLVRTIEQKEIKNRRITVQVPGSKSITNRALLLATLAEGRSTLYGALFSDDSRAFLDCVQRLGFSAEADEEARVICVEGNRFRMPKGEAQINVGSAGTAARFLTALLGISEGVWRLDASEQMKKRPMAPLLSCLRELGTDIVYPEQEEHFPFILHSSGVTGREIAINIDDSSQFLSAMLISCCRTGKDFIIHVTGSHGMAYIDITTGMMEEFGVRAIRQDTGSGIDYLVPGGQFYRAREYRIEPDVSAACYFYAMAMLLGISVTVKGVRRDTRQGDIALLRVLEQMGGALREEESGELTLTGPEGGAFRGVSADMGSFSDQALTLAVLAPFADGPTTITGIGHIRHQESDRIAAIVTELTKLGARCEELADGVRIYPSKLAGGIVSTWEDHRVAMSFALIGLRVPGIVIDNPACCRKTFENYFEVLEEAGRQCDGQGRNA